ncbi:MAG: CopD family protein [Actinomycetota bacterium]|nr:CopD family protein [Actinomycetota bacterium]
MPRRLLFLLLVLTGSIVAFSGTAAAHNSIESSSPADGDVLVGSSPQVTLVFVKPVPLDTLTVTLVAPDGVRSTLAGAAHGPNGDREVVVPMPQLSPGLNTLRWRLVGPDGHAITGRVEFTLQPPAPSVTEVAPETVPPPASPTTVGAPTSVTDAPSTVGVGDEWATPGWLRWLLRFGSYLAIMIAGGVAITEAYIWRATTRVRLLSRVTQAALVAVGCGAGAQLLIIASDISGRSPLSAWASLGTATDTNAGMALTLRIVLAFVAWLLVVEQRPSSPQIYQDTVVLLSLAMLATWSFAGHSQSMRWPWLGVPIDVLHHGAAAAWLGGLAIVAFSALPRLGPPQLVDVMARFSRVAEISVFTLVGTGLVQAIRLVGSPGKLLAADHGRLLVAKLALLALMLGLADLNRRRVKHRFKVDVVTKGDVRALRQMIRVELVVGLAVIGLTASLVVSPPATSTEAGASSLSRESSTPQVEVTPAVG